MRERKLELDSFWHFQVKTIVETTNLDNDIFDLKKRIIFFQKQFNSFDFDFEIYSRKNKTKQKKFHFDIPNLFCWIDLYQANKSFIFLFSVNFTIQPPIILINFIQVGNPITHIFIVCPLNEWMNAICCCCDSNPEWSLCWKYFQKKKFNKNISPIYIQLFRFDTLLHLKTHISHLICLWLSLNDYDDDDHKMSWT